MLDAEACRNTFLLHRGHIGFGNGAFAAFVDEGLEFGFVFCQTECKRMLGSNGSERDAHDRVRTCCVNTKFFLFAVEFVREGEVDTVGLADPVFLHAADLFGPALKLVEVFQEFFGVLSNSEVIAGDLTFFNDSAASPAASFDHLFVRQNGVVDRVPVHCLGLAVGNAFLKHFQEHPLIPAVVVRFAGRDFTGPVKSQTERFHLGLHVGDVVVCPFSRSDFLGDGGVFSRQAERVPAHRGHDVHAAHTQVAVKDVI